MTSFRILIGFTLAVLGAACTSTCGSGEAGVAARASQSPVGPGLRLLERDPTHVPGVMQALATVMAEIPRDTFDVSTLAGKVGSDPMTLTAWVRDNTYWVPYSGALRGPRGVLMDRLGSSLDRSLLLAQLLTEAGHSVRLATRTLSDAAASAIVTRAQAIPVEIPGTRLEVPGEPSAEEYTRYAELSGLDASVLKAGIAAMRSRATSAAEQAQRRIVSQTAFLTSATNAHPAANDRSVHAAAKEHWWVQLQRGSEWIDLDPLRPGEASAAHEAPQQG